MSITIIILTLDEIDGVSVIIPQISKNWAEEIVFVDGGSTDGTLEYFHKNNVKIVGQSKKGRGEAFRLAFQNSYSDVLIFFSPDGNENPMDILSIKNEIHNFYHDFTDLMSFFKHNFKKVSFT